MARLALGGGGSESEEDEGEASGTGGDPSALVPRTSIVADYEIEQEIGHGGMGVVYRARQRTLGRRVALKLLLLGRFADTQSVLRFRREAEAAARLRHPNIVTIHEGGVDAGQYFLAMDYICGSSLAQVLRAGPIPPARAVELVRKVALAMHYAHGEGIVHRDLKPSNVLMDDRGEPQVTDFGIAKRLGEQEELTNTGDLLGSPNYLSPEQASGRHREVGPASDVYALGAILYEMLTGRPPFWAASVPETLMAIRNDEPVAPRSLCPSVSMDLQAVVLKCLEKSISSRYSSAAELAEDLGRFTRGEPTRARPISIGARGCRWLRRRPVHALAIALALASVVSVGMSVRRTWSAKREVEEVNLRLARDLLAMRWQQAEDWSQRGRSADAVALFARLLRDQPRDPVLAGRLVSMLSQRAFAFPLGSIAPHTGAVTSVEFDPAEGRLLTASTDGWMRIWGQEGRTRELEIQVGEPVAHAWFGCDPGRVVSAGLHGGAALWSLPDRRLVAAFPSTLGSPSVARLSRDRRQVVFASAPRSLRCVDLCQGSLMGETLELRASPRTVAFVPGGDGVAVGTEQGTVQFWSVARADQPLWEVDCGSPVTALESTPRGDLLLVGTRRGEIRFLSSVDGAFRGGALDGGEPTQFIACSPDGARAVVARFGDMPEVWDLARLERKGVFQTSCQDVILGGAWSPGGGEVVLGYRSGLVQLLDSATCRPLQEPFDHFGSMSCLAFSAAGDHIATGSVDGQVRLWDVRRRVPPLSTCVLPGKPSAPVPGSGGGVRMVVHRDRRATVVDVGSEYSPGRELPHENPIDVAEVSPEGRRVLTRAGGWFVWDAVAGTRLSGPWYTGDREAAWSWAPNGSWVATVTRTGRFQRWDPATGRELGIAFDVAAAGEVRGIAFRGDGSQVAVILENGDVPVYDVGTAKRLSGLVRHRARVWAAEFSPDGNRLLTASLDRTARIWDLCLGKSETPPLRHDRAVIAAQFSPDGSVVATSGEDSTVRLWDSRTGLPLNRPLMQGNRVWTMEFSRDGRRLLTGAEDAEARVWDVATGFPLTEAIRHADYLGRVWFGASPEEIWGVTQRRTLFRSRWQVWSQPPPGWLAEFAEAVAGKRLDAEYRFEVAPSGVFDRLRASADPSDVGTSTEGLQWARGFLEPERDLPPGVSGHAGSR